MAPVRRKTLGALALTISALTWTAVAVGVPRATAATSDALVVTLNGKPTNVKLPLDFDVDYTVYTVCCSNGVPYQVPLLHGWSITAVIKAAGATPETTGSVTIEGAGRTVVLTRPDFDPSRTGGIDFLEGPAQIYPSESETPTFSFFRPIRAAAPADPNFLDEIVTNAGEKLHIDVRTGIALGVAAHASPTRVSAGANVHFNAQTTSPIAGERLTYVWTFSDGATTSGVTVDHAFSAAGVYQATASVIGDKGSGGTSKPVTISVGKATASGPTQRGVVGAPGAAGNGGGGSGGGGSGSAPGSGAGTRPNESTTTTTVPASSKDRAASPIVRIDGVLLAGVTSPPIFTAPGVGSGGGGRAGIAPAVTKAPSAAALPRASRAFAVLAALLAIALFVSGATGESAHNPLRRARPRHAPASTLPRDD